MVSKTKTIVTRSCYEAPVCKLYSITVETVIAASGEPGTADNGYGDNPLDDLGD